MRKTIALIAIFLSINAVAQDSLFAESLILEENNLNVESYFMLVQKTNNRLEYIRALQRENYALEEKISLINTYIKALNAQLEQSRASYSNLITFVYLNRFYSYNTFAFILSSRNFNEAFFRYKYIEIITKYIQKLHNTIKKLQLELNYQQENLQRNLSMQQKILKKIQHQKVINQEDLQILQQIESNKILYNKFVESLKEYEENQKFIFEEIASSLKTATPKGPINETFASLKGNLPAPLFDAKVIIPYGLHQHSTLKRIKIQNNGIDLYSKSDNNVKAVWDGKVTKVIKLPNYKYAVIIKHGSYFTVYSNLSNVKVKENQKVKKLQIIGNIKQTGNATLNFQIWHNTTKLNPKHWIKL